MKNFVVMLFAVLLTANVTAQNPYQLKNVQGAIRDVTTETATTNAWKYVNGVCYSLSVAVDSMWCVGGYTDYHIYKFNRKTRLWDQQPNMGTNVKVLAVQNSNNIYALMPTASCSGQYGIFFWTGSWTQRVGCYIKLSVSRDGHLRAIDNANKLRLSSDGGNTWPTEYDGWKWSQEAGGDFGCSIDTSNNIWATVTGGTSESLPAIPSGTIVGCLYATLPTVVLAWNTSGSVYAMPLETFGSWQSVTGLSASSITGAFRAFIFGQDSQGKVYHWNINAPTITATFGGQWNVGLGCPDHANPCTQTATHTVSHNMNFTSGHGYLGGLKQTTDLFTHDIEVANITYNPSCDPFFGQQADPECKAEIGATAFCNESHADVQNVDINYVVADSTDVMNYSYNIGVDGPMDVHTGPRIGYWLGYTHNAVIDACPVSDPVPVCPAETPADIEWRTDYFGDVNVDMQAGNDERYWMNRSELGQDSPYVYDSFYLAQQLPDGTLINTICFGDPHRPTDFLFGSLDIPHCK